MSVEMQNKLQAGQTTVTNVTHVIMLMIASGYVVTYGMTYDMCRDIRWRGYVTTQLCGTVDEMTCVTFVTVVLSSCVQSGQTESW